MSLSAIPSGQFKVGGDITVNRLGFGAMRVTGNGIWGNPPDLRAAREHCDAFPSSIST